jgi:hypothetical protein
MASFAQPYKARARSASDTKAAAEFRSAELISSSSAVATAPRATSPASLASAYRCWESHRGRRCAQAFFGVSPARTTEIVLRFLGGELRLTEAKVLDPDEEKYRAGEWGVRLFHTVLIPSEPTYMSGAV